MSFAFAEGAVTRLRREFKLLVPADAAQTLEQRLRRDAEPSSTCITSVYFDRVGFPLARRAHRTPEDCLKVRTKEYFPDVGSRSARVVLEAKRERNGLTQKERVWVPRSQLSWLEESEELWNRLPLLRGGALMPVLAVTYRREVYQHSATWRVTVDRDVSFHPVDKALAFGRRRLRQELLPSPFAREERVVVEVKHLGDELPEWLASLGAMSASRFSKFAEGMARMRRVSNQVQGG